MASQRWLRRTPFVRSLYSLASASISSRRIQSFSLLSGLTTPLRLISFKVDSANFENEVLQSQQAICLVYHIDNSNCHSYLRHAEHLIDELNSNTTLRPNKPEKKEEEESASSNSQKKEMQQHASLKFCTVNADENRNLASAFSVERAKLPITFFIMQGTIIDKVTGHIKENRLHHILLRFIEHYQKEMNVDLLVARGKESAVSGGMSSPLPAASTTDLCSGTTTPHMIQHLVSSLSGADRIHLPEEADKLDGLRKTIQETKRKAYGELVELRREIGLDVRNLSETEKETKYYRSASYNAMATISTLEALFLARSYATIGDIARKNIIWARRELTSSFEYVLTRTSLLRQLMALVDVNLVKGDLRISTSVAMRLLNRLPIEKNLDEKLQEGKKSEDESLLLHTFLSDYITYARRLSEKIDEFIDTRDFEVGFPSVFAEDMFTALKKSKKLLTSTGSSGGKYLSSASSSIEDEPWSTDTLKVLSATASSVDETKNLPSGGNCPSSSSISPPLTDILDKSSFVAKITMDQLRHAKVVLSCLVQLHIKDPKGQAARSRLASLVY